MILAQGNVSDKPFARIYFTLGAKAVSGELIISKGDQEIRTLWDKGEVVAASSPLAADSPSRLALSLGFVTRGGLSAMIGELDGISFEQSLAFIIQRLDLSEEKSLQLTRLACSQAAARQLAFKDAEFVLQQEMTLSPQLSSRLDAREIIYAGLKQHYTIDRLKREVAAIGARGLKIVEETDTTPFGFDDNAQSVVAAMRADELSIDELVVRTRLDESLVLAVVYALVASDCAKVGKVREVSQETANTAPAPMNTSVSQEPLDTIRSASIENDQVEPKKTINNDEIKNLILSRFEMLEADADHFKLLDLRPDADIASIQKGYFALAKKLHPDKLQAIGLTDLSTQAQRVFAAVNKAFSVLSNPKKMAEYRKVLEAGGEKEFARKKAEEDKQARKILEGEEHFYRGHIALKSQSFNQAVDAFAKAVDCNDQEGEYLAYLAWSSWCASPEGDEGVGSKALAQMRQALKLSPNSPNVMYCQGLLYKQMDRFDDAMAAFKKTLERDKKHHEAELELRLLKKRIAAMEEEVTGGGFFSRKKK